MRKFTRRFFATALTATLALSAAACGVPSVGSSEEDKKIDKSKEQIYVFNYDGGYKSAWLNAAAARYEALHANDTYNGKTGIQIMVTPVNGGVTAAGIKGGNYDIYSAEGIDYYSLVNSGALLDLTDVYTKDNPYETDKKVQDKLTASQEDYYNHEGKYYAIPNYAGFWGITYNIDLFEQKGFYIKDDADFADAENLDQYFTRNKNGRSAGPDGISGTSDDGLPVTYDEFFYLCQIMLTRSVTPIIWSSKYYEKHLCLTSLEHHIRLPTINILEKTPYFLCLSWCRCTTELSGKSTEKIIA